MTNKTNAALESGKAKVTSFGEKVKNEAGSVDMNNPKSILKKKSLLGAVAGGLVGLVVLASVMFGGSSLDPVGAYNGPLRSSLTITDSQVIVANGEGELNTLNYTDVDSIDIEGFESAVEFTMEDGTKMHLAQYENGEFKLGLLKKSGKLRGIKFTKTSQN